MSRFSFLSYSHIVLACFLLAACQTTTEDTTYNAKIDSALERAAQQNKTNKPAQSLSYAERIYKRKSDDPVAAVDYAAALRHAGQVYEAAAVLKPFAEGKNPDSFVLSEMSAIKLASGSYKEAEKHAQQAVLTNEKNYLAYQYLGIALDAQGMHPAAERAFRKGLDHWQGDPTTIMNNLALNLTTQGFLEEASDILQKAQTISPDRLEIERNLRIVTALQQSHAGSAPKPSKKPEAAPIDPVSTESLQSDNG